MWLFYAPTVTPPGQLVGPTRTCVKCQMVGAEVQPSVISAKENRWPRALPRTPGLPVTPLRLLVSRRKHSSSHWAGLQDTRRNVDVGQATPSRRFRRSCPCGAVPVTFPGSSPLPLGRLAASEGPRTQSCAWPARIVRCCEIASCFPHLHLKQDRQVYVSLSRKVCAFLRRNVLLPGMCPVNVFSRCRSRRPGRVRSVW